MKRFRWTNWAGVGLFGQAAFDGQSPYQDQYGRLPDAIRALGEALKASEAVNWQEHDAAKRQMRKDIERELASSAPPVPAEPASPASVLPIRDAAEFALRAVADTLLTVLLELPDRYADKHTIDRRIAIAAAQKMKGDALRAVDSAILNAALAPPPSPAQEKRK